MATLHIILAFISLHFFQTPSASGRVIVTVKNINVSKGGELSTGIFLEPNFPKVGKQLLGSVNPINASTMVIVFERVPVGNYGIVSFQDIDKNKLLKTNIVGYPTEPIGFSRDAKIKFGPPAFEDAKVRVEANQTLSVSIQLN